MDNKYSDLLNQYIDGELGPLEKIILEEHLLSCPASRRELNQLKLLDWELKHQPAIELPAELAACRMTALKAHMAASTAGEKRQKSSVTKDLWRMQLRILQNSSSFISINPVSRTLGRTVKGSFSLMGKAAGTALKKRKPLLGRFIPGQA